LELQIASDLHTEFGEINFPIPDNSEELTLILAGDIGVGLKAVDFIESICDKYRYVIYVAGNHEFYHQEMEYTTRQLYAKCEELSNVFFLEKDHVILDSILFFGGTFWTPGGTDHQNYMAPRNMSDFNVVRKFDPRYLHPLKVTPEVLRDEFLKTINSLKESLNRHSDFVDNVVVVSHHAPFEESSHPMFKGSDLNPFFYFDARGYLPNLDKISLWVHGHMHTSSDYLINTTRVVANPLGYPGENLGNYGVKIVEI
jgi:hypothetical protein